MIRWMRTAQVSTDKQMRALQFAKEMAERATKYEGVSGCTACMDAFGSMLTVRWMIDYDDMASLEKVTAQVMADQDYWKRVEQNADLFVQGSVQDTVMRSL